MANGFDKRKHLLACLPFLEIARVLVRFSHVAPELDGS
jgi:hypothetical protein